MEVEVCVLIVRAGRGDRCLYRPQRQLLEHHYRVAVGHPHGKVHDGLLSERELLLLGE